MEWFICIMKRRHRMKTGKAMMVVAVAGFAAVGTVHAGYSSLAERIRATGASNWANSQSSSSYSENAVEKCYVPSSQANAGYSSLADRIRANGTIDGANTRSLSSYANAAGVYSSSEPVGMSSETTTSADYSSYDSIVSKKKVSGSTCSFEEEGEVPADNGVSNKSELVLVADDDYVGSVADDDVAVTDDTSEKTTISNPVLASNEKKSSKSLMQQMNDEYNYLMSDELHNDSKKAIEDKYSDDPLARVSDNGKQYLGVVAKSLEWQKALEADAAKDLEYLKSLSPDQLERVVANRRLINTYLGNTAYERGHMDFGL